MRSSPSKIGSHPINPNPHPVHIQKPQNPEARDLTTTTSHVGSLGIREQGGEATRPRTLPNLVLVLAIAACGDASSDDSEVATTATSTSVQVVTTTEEPPPTTVSTTTTVAPSTTTTTVVESTATATYTGGECSYDGPTEFDLDTTATFTVTNSSETDIVGFSIWDFPEDVTSQEIQEQGIFEFVTFGEFAALLPPPTAIGESKDVTVTVDTPGQWGINCYDESGGGRGIDYVIMFTVND